jgi:hypothetical protein
MNDQRVHSNATAIDSDIYSDIFSTSVMREVCSEGAANRSSVERS